MADLGSIGHFNRVFCEYRTPNLRLMHGDYSPLNHGAFMENFSQNVSFAHSGALSGIVTDSDENPVSGAMMGLYDRASMQLVSMTKTNPAGAYSFEALRSVAEYFVVCLDPNKSADGRIHDNLTPGS